MSNDVTVSNYVIVLCLFALVCGYTCVISCITYLLVITTTSKSQEKINKNDDIEENIEIGEKIEMKPVSFKGLYNFVILFSICLLLWIISINVSNFQEKHQINKLLNSSSIVCNRTETINELIRIEKKTAFYDIRQHHYNVDITNSHLFGSENGNIKSKEWNQDKRMILLEYLTRLNNIDSDIFEKNADELLLFTYYRIRENDDVGNIADIRMRNNGYIIDNKFIENILLHSRCISPSDKSEQRHIDNYEVELMEFANNLHNVFYKKLKDEYRKIEYKYTLISSDFTEFDKLINEVQNNETEILSLDDYDLKRRKLQIREMKLLFEIKPIGFIIY